MSLLSAVYSPSLALLTDLYQTTMAYSYWKAGIHDREAVFNLYFRQHPFGGGYTIHCGLGHVIDYLQGFRFSDEDLTYLAGLRGNDGGELFEPAFLDYLRSMRFSCDVDAIPEGPWSSLPSRSCACAARSSRDS